MLGDGISDPHILASLKRIIPPHHALQLSELIDHLGHQIRLGKPCSAFGQIRGSAHFRGQFARQSCNPLDLVGNRAQLFLELDLGKLRQHRFKTGFLVIVPEEARIIEPRREHFRIAFRNLRPAIGRFNIRHGDKIRSQCTRLRITHRKILLMRPHGEPHDLRRQIKESRVHLAQNRHRPFGQPRHFFKQPFIRHQLKPRLLAERLGLFGNQRLAVGAREHDMPRPFKLALIVRPARHHIWPAPMHTVAFSLVTARKPINLERNNRAIKHADNPLQRPHPTQITRAPAHGFWPMEFPHNLRHGLGDNIRRRLPLFFNDCDVEIALFRVSADFRFVNRSQSSPAHKALNSLFRRADFRAFAFIPHIRRFGRQSVNNHSEPAWPRNRAHLVKAQPRRLQRIAERFAQIGLGLCLHPCRNFFGK